RSSAASRATAPAWPTWTRSPAPTTSSPRSRRRRSTPSGISSPTRSAPSTASPAPRRAWRSRSADVRVLVAGGTEFISLHLVRGLLRDGHVVTVLNRGRQPDRLPAGVRPLVADRKDHAAVRKAL